MVGEFVAIWQSQILPIQGLDSILTRFSFLLVIYRGIVLLL